MCSSLLEGPSTAVTVAENNGVGTRPTNHLISIAEYIPHINSPSASTHSHCPGHHGTASRRGVTSLSVGTRTRGTGVLVNRVSVSHQALPSQPVKDSPSSSLPCTSHGFPVAFIFSKTVFGDLPFCGVRMFYARPPSHSMDLSFLFRMLQEEDKLGYTGIVQGVV